MSAKSAKNKAVFEKEQNVVNAIQYDTIRYDTIRYNTIQCNTMQCNAMQYNAIQYNAMRCDAMQLYFTTLATHTGQEKNSDLRL